MRVLKGMGMEPYDLTQEQLDEYNERGYIVVEGLFSELECDEMVRHCKKHADEKFSAILNIDRKEEEIRSVMKAPKVISILEKLNGGKLVGLMSQIIFKEVNSPYANQAWAPHQDNSYPQNKNGLYVTINIACEKQDLENGCLYIYPGSHKGGLYDCEFRQSYREEEGKAPGNFIDVSKHDFAEPVNCFMKKGDALFLHGNVVHGSFPNKSDKLSRPLIQCTYINEGEDFVPGKNANRTAISLEWDAQ